MPIPSAAAWEDLKEIKRRVLGVGAGIRTKRRPSGAAPSEMLIGMADAQIDAATESSGDITPGSGTVSVYRPKTTDPLVLEDSGRDVTGYNLSSEAITPARPLQLKQIIGYWFVDFESCDDL